MKVTIVYFEDMMTTAFICRVLSSFRDTTFSYKMENGVATIDAQTPWPNCIKELESKTDCDETYQYQLKVEE